MTHKLDEVSRFTNSELVCSLKRLVKADRSLCAELLVHLGEVQERGLFADLGYCSMFEYCRSGLHMSEAEAYFRIQAAGVARRFPLVLERVAAGALHLSAIKLVAPHLTVDNHVQLLDRVSFRTKREIERLVAELAPKPDVPARMRKVPVQSARARACSTPLGLGRFKLVLTLGQEGQDALEQLVELFRHQNPSGDFASIVERALRELLERTVKRRFAQTSAPARQVARTQEPASGANADGRGTASSVRSRYIPRRVLREVYARDQGQCTFVSPEGRRCAARGFLEVHHHDATYARGGEATVGNLRLTCRAHNLMFADRDYGRRFMREKLREVVVRRNRASAAGAQSLLCIGP